MPPCSHCQADVAVLHSCLRCRQVAYCSAACQAQHWQQQHKTECCGCPICHEDLGPQAGVATTVCGHVFHQRCLRKLTTSCTEPLLGDLKCPLCRSPLLCWLSADVPCGFRHSVVVRLFLGVMEEAVEQYQLVLLMDVRSQAWLQTLEAHPALAMVASHPVYVKRDICSTKSQIVCCPSPPVDQPWSTGYFFLVCLLAPAQLRNICALRSASQESDLKHVVRARRRYWLVLASPAGNKLAELVRVGANVGALRAGAPPELPELPAARTAHWAYEPRDCVPWRACVRWLSLLRHPTEEDKAALNAQFLTYSPELLHPTDE